MDVAKIFRGIPAPDTEDFDALVAFCEGNEPLVLASLHTIVAELAAALGFRETFILVRDYGGAEIYFSKKLSSSIPIKNPLIFDRIFKYNGVQFDLPGPIPVLEAIRGVAIGIEIFRGESFRKTCRRYGMAERSLRKRLNSKGKPFLADAAAKRGKTPAECFPGYGSTAASQSHAQPFQNPFNVDPIAEA